MKKPKSRIDLPPRESDNDKRSLHPAPDQAEIQRLCKTVHYVGHPKHKASPVAYGLPPYHKPRGDATLCDTHAGFAPSQMSTIPRLLRRGIKAGLIGETPRILWAIGDDGWIFEGRITNTGQNEYHGYPVRPSEPIAEAVFLRFKRWAQANGKPQDLAAAERCQALYGFKP